jgi:hypothetical protein
MSCSKISDSKLIDTIDLLYESWDFDIDNKVSKKDAAVLYYQKELGNENLKLSYFYQTHVLPHPWWGNINNPKVIVLGLNPSYDPINDEMDDKLPGVYDALLNNIDKNKNPINWLNFSDAKTSQWWKITLGTLIDSVDNELLYKNVGFFNLCGYHRDSYKNVQQKCLIKKENMNKEVKEFVNKFDFISQSLSDQMPRYNDKYLPTQNAIILHINKLIRSSEVKHVILLWGYNEWFYAGINLKDSEISKKLLIVNKYNSSNHCITNTYLLDKKYYEKVSKKKDFFEYLSSYQNNKDDEKIKAEYKKLFESIEKVIKEN